MCLSFLIHDLDAKFMIKACAFNHKRVYIDLSHENIVPFVHFILFQNNDSP